MIKTDFQSSISWKMAKTYNLMIKRLANIIETFNLLKKMTFDLLKFDLMIISCFHRIKTLIFMRHKCWYQNINFHASLPESSCLSSTLRKKLWATSSCAVSSSFFWSRFFLGCPASTRWNLRTMKASTWTITRTGIILNNAKLCDPG